MGQGFNDFGMQMSGASQDDIMRSHLNDINRQNQEDQAKYGVGQIGLDQGTLQKQNDFVSALQGQVAGTGPSVAGTMLKSAQDQNNANSIAMAQSARGVNPGLALRQATQNNAVANQQANQAAATARAQEQLGATGMLGSQLNNMQQQGVNVQAQNQNASLASKGLAAGAQAQKSSQGNDLMGGLLQGAGTAAMLFAAKGGAVPRMADGGAIASIAPMDPSGPSSAVGRYFNMAQAPSVQSFQNAIGKIGDAAKKTNGGNSQAATPSSSQVPDMSGQSATSRPDDAYMPGGGFAKGGRVPAMVSPGERYLSPREVDKVAEGKKAAIKAGEKIPGKPKVKGAKDSYANDTVPKTLQSGGIVLPRHVTEAKDAPKKAAEFVAAIIAKQGLKRK